MSLIRTLGTILNHPLNRRNRLSAILRFFKWQVSSRLIPFPIIFSYCENSELIVAKSMTGATGNLYCGLHEFEDMSFLLHYLREDDTFIDIGANVGSYTILGANEVGASTVAIEPIPKAFDTLRRNVLINQVMEKVDLHNIGLGSKNETLLFTKSLDTVNHVAKDSDIDVIEVPVLKFDELIKISSNTLVKIDVEGYETEVVKGMEQSLKLPGLQVIIIELNGSSKRYGFDDNWVHNEILKSGFAPYRYFPFERRIERIETFGPHNTIYIKNRKLAEKRVLSAKKIKVFDNSI